MPDGYVLNPDRFVAWLESRGWITLFGDWVLKTALKDWNRWMPSWNTLSLRVCVNVSAYQLRDHDFASAVRKRLEKHSMDASAIELELTEGTPWHDLDEISRQLSALRREGARVVLDDFGQGVSGLSALRNLPLDGIKIDRAFISGIESDSRRQAIVASSIQMAHNLGLTVTAEGVETEAEWARLRELACDVVQGFWVSRPVAWEALSRFREYTPGSWAGRGDLVRMDF
jgi:EAL domain-containing protein (putative c-di-GMP-specific phosphodiesterase class I)